MKVGRRRIIWSKNYSSKLHWYDSIDNIWTCNIEIHKTFYIWIRNLKMCNASLLVLEVMGDFEDGNLHQGIDLTFNSKNINIELS